MTTDERKRGLRAAVDAKLSAHMEAKRAAIDTLCGVSADKHAILAYMVNAQILWEIIDSLVDECAVPLTIETICRRVAEHYSRKLNGKVTCEYLDPQYRWDGSEVGRFEIHGVNLPPHPDFKEKYPNGWEMLDRISLEKALEIAQDVRPADTPKEEA